MVGDQFREVDRLVDVTLRRPNIRKRKFERMSVGKVLVEPGDQPARHFDGAEGVVANRDLTEGVIVLTFGQHLYDSRIQN